MTLLVVTADNATEIVEFCHRVSAPAVRNGHGQVVVHTMAGSRTLAPGHVVILDDDDITVLSEATFNAAYEVTEP